MKENWKEEFDKLVESFDDWSGDSDGNEHYCPNPDWKKVKYFIENLLEQEKKRIMSLPCMEEEKLVGDPSDVLTASRNFLRRELKEAIINKK